MSRALVRTLSLLALPLTAYACGEAADPAAPSPSEATRIQIVEGEGQYGRTGMYFPDHLVVLVTDADGQPVPDARVEWSVVDGPLKVSSESTVTNRYGRTKITAGGGRTLGSGMIRARLATAPDVETFFHEKVSAYQVIMKSDQYKEMTFSSSLTVEVGDTIEWRNKDMTDTGGTEHYMHSATSVSWPEDGESFDSPMLKFDETYRWVPRTTGTWTYECDDHPQAESMYGTIEVVAPK